MTTHENINPVKDRSVRSHGLQGIFAGAFVGTLLQPLEIVKIGMIIGPANNPKLKQELQSGNIITHMVKISKHIYRTEGFKGFFRSYIPSLFRNGGGSGVYFYTLCELDYFANNYILKGETDSKKHQQFHFINSALARVTSTIFINPFSVVGSRIEVPGFNEYSGMRDGFRQVYQKEGIPAFFKGVVATALKDGPFAGLYLVIYRAVKKELEKQEKMKLHYSAVSMISGMIAGAFATLSSHPLEIVRARVQVNQSNQKQGIMQELRRIKTEEGVYGYFRGITPRLVKKPIANALTFVVFEAIHFNVNGSKW